MNMKGHFGNYGGQFVPETLMYPLEELDAAVETWVGSIVESGPRAIRLQKELIREWEAMPVGAAIQAGIRMMGRAYETEEPQRMVAAARARLRDRKK